MMTWLVIWETETDNGTQVCSTWDEAWAAFAGLAENANNDAVSCEVFTLVNDNWMLGTKEASRVLSFHN